MRLDLFSSHDFTLRFRATHDALDPNDTTLAATLDHNTHGIIRVLPLIDQGLAEADTGLPQRLSNYAEAHAINAVDPVTLPAGESAKNNPDVLERALDLIDQAKVCRKSAVLAIGGGGFLDVVGFAAATAHRGVRLIRLPSTTLSQADSGVGVKNGVNRKGKKNFLGAFAPPHAVINSAAFLRTLTDDDWRSGFSEAVKIALIKDADLFKQLEENADRIAQRDLDAAIPIINRAAELHLRHIAEGGDPFETTDARPLDFGHWAAHRLEEMSNFQLRHGDAVAIGMTIDMTWGVRTNRINPELLRRTTRVLQRLGFTLHHTEMNNTQAVIDGLESFREHLGGPLTLTLPTELGQSADHTGFDPATILQEMTEAIEHVQSEGTRV